MKNIYDKSSSKDLANKRLKVILIHDRACLDDKFLETIKGEIMNIIAKYVQINNSQVEVKLITNDIEEAKSSILVANIPIKIYIIHKCAFILDVNSMKLIWNSIYIFQINFFLYI